MNKRQQILLNHLHPKTQILIEHEPTKHETSIIPVELTDKGIIILYLNNPPVNACSNELLSALDLQLEKAYGNSSCKGIVLTSKIPKFFVAGAGNIEFNSFRY